MCLKYLHLAHGNTVGERLKSYKTVRGCSPCASPRLRTIPLFQRDFKNRSNFIHFILLKKCEITSFGSYFEKKIIFRYPQHHKNLRSALQKTKCLYTIIQTYNTFFCSSCFECIYHRIRNSMVYTQQPCYFLLVIIEFGEHREKKYTVAPTALSLKEGAGAS